MPRFTDIFIKRPVLATVVSLLILLIGFRSLSDLSVRQYPEVENTVIKVTTTYPGASADVIQGFITNPIQKSVASADGIDYLTATSTQGLSTIEAHIVLNYDPDKAFVDVMSKVAEVRSQLPQNAQDPVIEKDTGSTVALMYLSFSSDVMKQTQITDFISRVVQPEIETVAGVSNAQILGANTFAMRIWLDPRKMASRNVTPQDVANALIQNNYQSAAGNTKGQLIAYSINAETNTDNVEAFRNIVVKHDNDMLIRLKDVAKIELGSESYDSNVQFNGTQATFVAITSSPSANPLTVISKVKEILPKIEKTFPPNLHLKVVYDATEYIRASIDEVIHTILEASIIVIIVIFAFLGSLRSVLIPVITIPLSLIGVCSLMLALGYSINLLTLLAMVLAIGMVVDDAIVVVENIFRHIEEGSTPFQAALEGAREIAVPIISMTITLAAVYAPIGFMGGLTGALFKEFAFTLASAVILSGVIALTLSPMMCSKLLNHSISDNRLVKFIDDRFDKIKQRYQSSLHNSLNYKAATLVFAITVLLSIGFLYTHTHQELAPVEDQSVLFMQGSAPEYANINYVTTFTNEFNKIFNSFPEKEDFFVVNGSGPTNSFFAGLILKPWDQRSKTQMQIQPELQKKIKDVAGLQSVVFPLPSLPTGTDGVPIQFVLTSTGSFQLLYQTMEKLITAAKNSNRFIYVDSSLKFDQPQVNASINRAKAAQLGLTMQQIGDALATTLGGNYVNWFDLQGRSYKVIPLLERRFRLTEDQIKNIYVNSIDNTLVPLSTFMSLKLAVQPNALTTFQQLNAATLNAVPMPGITMGSALNYLQQEANKILPKGITYDYAGESRSFVQEGNTLVYTFIFALIAIFLVLSAQFESFRDPLIVLFSVPMSICGALIFLNLGLATINIYTQVGLITLIGLISKHGILLVEFANQLQRDEKLSKRQAIEKAATIRLRPILMTTAAMILGVLPLLLASGAGSRSRHDIGLVIATGMFVGTLFTLYVVPTIYLYIAAQHQDSP